MSAVLILVRGILRTKLQALQRFHFHGFSRGQPGVDKPGRLGIERLVNGIQLVLHTLASLGGKVDDFPCLLIGHPSVGIEQLAESGKGLADGQMVAFGQRAVKSGVLLQCRCAVVIPQLVQHGGYVVRYQPVSGRKAVLLQNSDFPSGIIQVDAVEEGSFDEGRGNGLKQVRVFQHIRHGVLGISHEYHRCAGFMCPLATVERLVGQVVLHGVYQHGIHVSAFLLLELVPCYHVPVAHQPQYLLVALHLDKQPGRGYIASADQHAVGRQFLEHVALACAFRPQLHKIVIVFHMRQQPCQRDEFLAAVHHLRVQADRVHQEVQPFLRGEVPALFDVFL